MPQLVPVILCGGSGTRLWPLSRKNFPKQFMDIGSGKTLFGETLKRLDGFGEYGKPICVCNEKYRFYVTQQLEHAQIILEPCANNTAPAIALAALAAQKGRPDSLLLVLPADHHFDNTESFVKVALDAMPLAQKGYIITFGLQPQSPATGFGYIHAGDKIGENIFGVSAFLEKPDEARAREMLACGCHYWNMGVFLFRPDVYLAELGRYAPEILAKCQEAIAECDFDSPILRPSQTVFASCPADSIDYAIMEHTDKAAVAPVSCGWNDMGSWESFYEDGRKDAAGNVADGRVMLEDVEQSFIHSDGRLVAAIGVKNVTIVETADAVLVMGREHSQKVRDIVDRLKKENAEEYVQHRLVQKPWGCYEILARGDRFQVKRIMVRPGESISMQMHHHRAEHWIVVNGTAEITNGTETNIYTENQSTYIPVGNVHKLRNPGLIPLFIIEIQSGSYLGEDDIVRLEDPYERQKGE